MLRKPFSFCLIAVFTNETKMRISIDGIVSVFLKKWNEISWKKNTKNLSSDKRSIMCWDVIQSDGQKLLFKCPNKLNALGYLEFLKNSEEKMHFLDIVFLQDNAPVHKSKIIGKFFQGNE